MSIMGLFSVDSTIVKWWRPLALVFEACRADRWSSPSPDPTLLLVPAIFLSAFWTSADGERAQLLEAVKLTVFETEFKDISSFDGLRFNKWSNELVKERFAFINIVFPVKYWFRNSLRFSVISWMWCCCWWASQCALKSIIRNWFWSTNDALIFSEP